MNAVPRRLCVTSLQRVRILLVLIAVYAPKLDLQRTEKVVLVSEITFCALCRILTGVIIKNLRIRFKRMHCTNFHTLSYELFFRY